jgi:molecular chaperone GrpE
MTNKQTDKMKKSLLAPAQPGGPEPVQTPGAVAESEVPVAPAAAPSTETAPSPEAPLSPQEIDELKTQAGKAKAHWDQLLRTAADFDNFKKRVARERQEAAKYAFEPLLVKLIPVLDHFDMALAAAAATQDKAAQALQTGISMMYQQFKKVLAESGLEEIDALNRPFDPAWHEAVSQVETAEVPEGQVVQQLRKGYKLRDRLLRPAGVIVAKQPAAQDKTEPPPKAAAD